jgi:hypothetical protein
MKVKIDTKAHFKVFTVPGPEVHANMAGELVAELGRQAATAPHHLIMVLDPPARVEGAVRSALLEFGGKIAASQLSFVTTGILAVDRDMTAPVAGLNTAPTYAEAVDIVMMEELERELGAADDRPEEEAGG